MIWNNTQQEIQSCRRCEMQYVTGVKVPSGEKRRPPWEPLSPVRLYFVSVAPPYGGDYFWDETKYDAVRDGLFKALRSLPRPIDKPITTCREFWEAGFFLTPAVKCPSSNAERDVKPSAQAIANCLDFLRSELVIAEPQRILALGRIPFNALCQVFGLAKRHRVKEFRKTIEWVNIGQKEVPLMGTYFPGNNRHRGFESVIEDIDRLLELAPYT